MLVRFKQFMSEGNPLSRIWKLKQQGHSMIALSGERGDKSKAENKARNKEVEKDLRAKGLGYRKVKGTWEGGSEDSIIAHSRTAEKKDKRSLRKTGKEIATKMDQDAVGYHGGKDRSMKMIGTNDSGWPGRSNGRSKVRSVGKIKFNRKNAEFQTKTKGGSFTTEK